MQLRNVPEECSRSNYIGDIIMFDRCMHVRYVLRSQKDSVLPQMLPPECRVCNFTFISVGEAISVAGSADAAYASVQQQCKLGSWAVRASRRPGKWERGTYQQRWISNVQSTVWSRTREKRPATHGAVARCRCFRLRLLPLPSRILFDSQ